MLYICQWKCFTYHFVAMRVEHLYIVSLIDGTSVQIMTAIIGIGPGVDIVTFVIADCVAEVVAFAWHNHSITQVVA